MTSKPEPVATQPLEIADEDRTICFCHHVSARELKVAIAAGAETIEAIQAETCASTGCGGCELDVREILEIELELKKKTVGQSGE